MKLKNRSFNAKICLKIKLCLRKIICVLHKYPRVMTKTWIKLNSKFSVGRNFQFCEHIKYAEKPVGSIDSNVPQNFPHRFLRNIRCGSENQSSKSITTPSSSFPSSLLVSLTIHERNALKPRKYWIVREFNPDSDERNDKEKVETIAILIPEKDSRAKTAK